MSSIDNSKTSWRTLTSLERFLLRLNEQLGDMAFRVDLHFDGHIEPARLLDACQYAVKKHPLLRSHIEACSTWVENDSLVQVTAEDIGEMPAWVSRPLTPLEIREGAGVAIHLTRSSDNKSLISFDFDHVRVDGQGAGRYVRDVLQRFFANSEVSDKEIRIDYEQLHRRGEYVAPTGELALSSKEKFENLWVTVRGSNLRFPAKRKASSDDSEPLHSTKFIEADETRSLREVIRARGYTLNDFALAASMIAIAELRSDISDSTHVCMMNPVDLRTWADRRLSASNRFGFAFVRRQIRSLRDPGATLASVVEQMSYVRKRGVAADLIQGFELAEKIPGLLPYIDWSKRFIPTANFTCMSNSSPGRRIGLKQEKGTWGQDGISLTRVSGYGPLPPHVPLSLALCDNGSVLSLNVRGRVGSMGLQQVEALADSWQHALIGLTKLVQAE